MLKISKKGRKSIPYDENQNSSMTQFQRQIFIFYLQNKDTNGNIYNRGAVHEAAWWSNRKNQTSPYEPVSCKPIMGQTHMMVTENKLIIESESVCAFQFKCQYDFDRKKFKVNIKQLNVFSAMNLEHRS